ncbi:MAG: hypothetical protein V1810_04290 [Candidatus Beckwithbacteria bacterium]
MRKSNMNDIFTRSSRNPILRPNPKNDWEALKVYNPGVLYENNVYHLFYRARGKGGTSTIGYAISKDGEKFQRFNEPLIVSENNSYSIEDPRIAKVEDKYFLTHTFYNGINVTLNLVTSKDLKLWENRGEMLVDWDLYKGYGFLIEWDPAQVEAEKNPTARIKWSKAGAIFPELIQNKYWMLFGDRNIWLASSTDGIKWQPIWEPFIKPRGGNYFDNEHVEMGPPPLKTEKGWLVLYHGVNQNIEYKIGFLILDLHNPARIISRSEYPIFEPREYYELSGLVDILPGGYETMMKMGKDELNEFIKENEDSGKMPKVVFSCGAVLVNGEVRIYYGASDQFICTATASLNDIL